MFGLAVSSLRSSFVAFCALQSTTTIFRNRAMTMSPLHSTASTSNESNVQYLLRYDYIPDVLEKRGPHREGHLNLAKELIDQGTCLAGGPTTTRADGPPTGALFIFTTPEAADHFLQNDPYVSNNIVTKHTIEEWNIVVQKQ